MTATVQQQEPHTATVKIMSPEEIVARGGGRVEPLRLPEASSLFAERALRLRQLAAGHAMRDFLIFMADLAQAQHLGLAQLLRGETALPLPSAAQMASAQAVGRPPLPAADWPRDPAWHGQLAFLIDELMPRAPAETRAVLTRLREASPDDLERQADCLLNGVMLGLDLATAPLVAAALQSYWTALALLTQARHGPQSGLEDRAAFARTADETLCPCCGSRPTASITRMVGDVSGQRYLHCSLCATEWHMVRIQCAHCLSGLKLAYESLQAADAGEATGKHAAVQAETCDACGHYLKIVHTERDPFVEPAADDLASLTLDLLVSDTGLARWGVNLMLLFGEPEPPPPDSSPGRP